jgi:hypothetical protein
MNLTEAIKATAPHATKDKTLPMLTGVQIQNGRTMATDRYTLALVAVEGLPLDVTVWLSPEDVKAGVAAVTNELITFTNGSTKSITEAPGDYPTIERLADGFEPNKGEPIPAICFDVKHLSKFDSRFFPRAFGLRAPLFTFGQGPNKSVKVTFSNLPEYVGLIVPIRTVESKA